MSKGTALPAMVAQQEGTGKKVAAAAMSQKVEDYRLSMEKTLESLKELQENAGQISEFELEEKNLVNEFFSSLLKIMETFGKKIELSVSALPEDYGRHTSKAFLYPVAQLVLVHKDLEVEVIDLSTKESRDLLVELAGEIMLKLKKTIDAHRTKVEKRVSFFMAITEELQKIAKIFSRD